MPTATVGGIPKKIKRGVIKNPPPTPKRPERPPTIIPIKTISTIPPIVIGFFVGVLSAMMGVGGGFIIIPAMVYILGMSTNVVVGTSLFQIIFVTANSTFFQSYLNQTVDIVLASLMIVGGVIGAQIGAQLGTKLKAEYLRGILAILVLSVCAKIFTDLTLTPADLFSLDLL